VNQSDRPEGLPKPAHDESGVAVDSSDGSVTQWIGDLKAGDPQAFAPLWDRYYALLVERARAKLAGLRGPRAVHDEEDLALSAFHSLYLGLREGSFPRLDDRDDLWKLLVHVTACKAVDHHRAEARQKRGGGNVVNEADMVRGAAAADDRGGPLDQLICTEPSPEFAAMVAEEITAAIEQLSADDLARVRAWLAEYAEQIWDEQIERDERAGRLDALIERALTDHRAGRPTRPLSPVLV
jgi:hypothetical protein